MNGPSCFLIGADSLLTLCGDALQRSGFTVRGVITQEPRLVQWANTAGIAVLAPNSAWLEALRQQPFDYLFAITHLEVLPAEVIALPAVAAINFHDGPLPRYAGLNAPAWALLHRETHYGITWHLMTAAIDDGGILAQEHFDLTPEETALSLNTRCFELGLGAFERLLPQLRERRVTPTPQDHSQRSYFGRHRRPDVLGLLDWRRSASELDARVRALDFGTYRNPLCTAKVLRGGRAAVVVKANGTDATPQELPGTVLAVDASGVTVAAGFGTLRILAAATLDGQPLSPLQLASHLAIATGDRLDELNDQQAARCTALGNELARHDQIWAKRLQALLPLELPQANPNGNAHGKSTAREGKLVAASAEALAGLLAAYLARVGQRDVFDLAFSAAALEQEIAGLEALVSPVVPARIQVDWAAPLGVVQASVAAALAEAVAAKTFALDTVTRHPELRGQVQLAAGRLLPVAVVVRANLDTAQLPVGCQVALVTRPDGQASRWLFDARALSEAAVESVERGLLALQASAAAQPATPLSHLDLMPATEHEAVVLGFNRTTTDYARERCIHQAIEAQATRTPHTAAVICGSQSLTYAELDRRAGLLAARLQQLGAGPDTLVGIHIERSVELLVAVLGTLKAGAAYVPLDPAYPSERLAWMLEDSAAPLLLTQEHLLPSLPATTAAVVCLDRDWPEIERQGQPQSSRVVASHHLAYVIYTSGSTGRPKGVMVEHRNVANFFAGMDARLGAAPGTWLAVTSLSFDISVLELLWTTARGFTVVLHADPRPEAANAPRTSPAAAAPLPMGLFFWGNDDGPGAQKYRLMLEASKFADAHGFVAVWTPERHFHAFGGPFPNPSVTGAAIAAVTKNIGIRAGSVVSPLHHPIRLAEDWAVIDNLSNGRVGMAFASGWMPEDFVLRPEAYADHKRAMLTNLDLVRRLWRGDKVPFQGPLGPVEVTTLPRPVQRELPFWITTAGNPDTWRQAGELGANLLTHLLGQTVEELDAKVKLYRQARAAAGHDPNTGVVTLMLHTLVGDTDEHVKSLVRQPMKAYLGASLSLVKQYAWAFPAFKRPGGAAGDLPEVDLTSLTEAEKDAILEHAFERYFEHSGLFGAPDTCVKMLERVAAVGIDEIACLVDFGVSTDVVLAALPRLQEVRNRPVRRPMAVTTGAASPALTATELLGRHGVTHLQCTPSRARLLLAEPNGRAALAQLDHLLLGGEALPPALAQELKGLLRGKLTNLYGPTETTVWSTTQTVVGDGKPEPIGTPIANTTCYVLDARLQPLPPGVQGDLWIGGEGVVRGYHGRADLTAERFVADPFRSGGRMYRTGDLARWRNEGVLEFLGRADFQVKLRGYRIELGEIEARLAALTGVREAVVLVREDEPGDQRLVAYVVAHGAVPEAAELQGLLATSLPEFMVPGTFVLLDRLPQTPNGKVDRQALPRPAGAGAATQGRFVAPDGELETRLAAAWQDVLRQPRVGADDNFFRIGGHSLLAIQLHRELVKTFAQLALTDIYRFPTVRDLAAFLRGAAAGGGSQLGADRAAKRRAARARS